MPLIAASSLTAALSFGGFVVPAHAAMATPPDGASRTSPGGLGNVINGIDNSVNVFVGGNFKASRGAAESEGALVVEGDAMLDSGGGLCNIGVVGLSAVLLLALGALPSLRCVDATKDPDCPKNMPGNYGRLAADAPPWPDGHCYWLTGDHDGPAANCDERLRDAFLGEGSQ